MIKKKVISIILVEPEGADNIGAAARAMKNMGLRDLRLVRPPRDWKRRAKKMAMRADDLIACAKALPSLKRAIRDRHLVIGTTRRSGARRGTFVPFHQAIPQIRKESRRRKIAIVFGRESKGLSNRDLALCDWLVTIPAHPAYPSLNLAQAVMVVAFAIAVGSWNQRFQEPSGVSFDFVPKKEIDDMLSRFEQALRILGYEREGGDVISRILAAIRTLSSRAGGLLPREAQMLKGLSRRIVERFKS